MSKASTKVISKVGTGSDKSDFVKSQGRKTLKVLQKDVTGNLIGRSEMPSKQIYKAKADSETEITELAKRKKLRTQSTQTDAVINTELQYNEDQEQAIKDMTAEEGPSEGYWEIIAEKRRQALEVTLDENRYLNNRVEGLEAELDISRKMLDEARALVDLLNEMLEDAVAGEDPADAVEGLNGLLQAPEMTLNSTGASAAFEAPSFEESSDEAEKSI